MFSLSGIVGSVIGSVVDRFIGPAKELFSQYLNNKLSETELREKLAEALLVTFRTVEVEAYQTLAKTYSTMMGAAVKSPLIRAVWATVTLSQLGVLLWHQIGIPALVYATGERYPSSGTTVDWAYALVFGCLGLGPMVMRNGPTGPGGLAGALKTLAGR